MVKTVREIGSEYSRSGHPVGAGFQFPRKGTLTFSGRTAIETVLKHAPNLKTALLPSYCCDSMIEPFRKAGLDITFFNVNYKDGMHIDLNGSADILLWCNYFGFENELPDFDGIVIEDITHSLLSERSHHERSDHLVASLRKWWPIYCGGYCSIEAALVDPPHSFIEKKAAAMDLKADYLNEPDDSKKSTYLSAFSESNHWLAEHYSGLRIDSFSEEYINHVDADAQRTLRKKNADILYAGLHNRVDFLFDKHQMDCPLFVPIIVKKDRDKIRQALIEEKIYCPIHWPRPCTECVSNLYDQELSLICDQRYNENDMDRIVSVLNKII